MEKFNASLPFDKRMWQADITGSQAYAKALALSKIITDAERDTLVDGLARVGMEWENGTFDIKPSDEDIHTANERRLGELVGSVAGKLHTGRSRNDQVATDMRLWLREEATKLLSYLKELIAVAVSRAETEIDVIMPGYTHLQVGNRVLLGKARRGHKTLHADGFGISAGTTHPLVPLAPCIRMVLACRRRTPHATHPPYQPTPSWQRRSCRQPFQC